MLPACPPTVHDLISLFPQYLLSTICRLVHPFLGSKLQYFTFSFVIFYENIANLRLISQKSRIFAKELDILNEKSCFFHYIDAFRDKNGGSRESDGV